MNRFFIVAAVLLVSMALLTSAQWHDGDDDGCIETGSGRCIKGNRPGWRGKKERCNGQCINTGSRGHDKCQCQEPRFGNRRPGNGWNDKNGWGK